MAWFSNVGLPPVAHPQLAELHELIDKRPERDAGNDSEQEDSASMDPKLAAHVACLERIVASGDTNEGHAAISSSSNRSGTTLAEEPTRNARLKHELGKL